MSSEQDIQTRVIKASYVLQSKVGSGPLDARKVRESQEVIDNNKVDFVPLGLEFLDQLEAILKEARAQKTEFAELRELLTQPVMQLKANAGLFKYDLVGSLAGIMLSYLENVREIDNDVYEIVGAHHNTLRAIVTKRMSGDCGTNGKMLQNELKDACRRYFVKRNIPIGGVFVTNAG